jgi:hypothetical protein
VKRTIPHQIGRLEKPNVVLGNAPSFDGEHTNDLGKCEPQPITRRQCYPDSTDDFFKPPRTPILGDEEPKEIFICLGNADCAPGNLRCLIMLLDLALAIRLGAQSVRDAEPLLMECAEKGIRSVNETVAHSSLGKAATQLRDVFKKSLTDDCLYPHLLYKKAEGFSFCRLTLDGEIAFKAACRLIKSLRIRGPEYFSYFEGWKS